MPPDAEETITELLSALHAMLEGSGGRGHVESAVEGGCLRVAWSSSTRFVGVRMAAMV